MKTKEDKILRLALALAALALNLSPMHQPNEQGPDSHSATLLPNGKVLVAGGSGNTTTELFDPATETWTVTGALRAYRSGHSATLLPNGKVLVAGGEQANSSILSNAELYDSNSGTWASTAPMRKAREAHTATLLPDGKVLVAGGFGNPCCTSSLASAELFDPASGTWTTTGAMTVARDSHTATLLPNGKVLVAGGTDPGADNSSAELYHPLPGTWTVTGSLSHTYSDHGATLLTNGKVLVAGGCPSHSISSDNNTVVELYDPASGTWTPTGPLITGRGVHTATLLPNGKVLIAGGYENLYSAELYDPAAGTWTETELMSDGRWAHTATLLSDGKVLIAGGLAARGLISSAELYEPDSAGAVPFITLLHHSDQIMSFSWSGAGTLEQSDTLIASNWHPAPSQANPQILGTTDAMKFYRVKAD